MTWSDAARAAALEARRRHAHPNVKEFKSRVAAANTIRNKEKWNAAIAYATKTPGYGKQFTVGIEKGMRGNPRNGLVTALVFGGYKPLQLTSKQKQLMKTRYGW